MECITFKDRVLNSYIRIARIKEGEISSVIYVIEQKIFDFQFSWRVKNRTLKHRFCYRNFWIPDEKRDFLINISYLLTGLEQA